MNKITEQKYINKIERLEERVSLLESVILEQLNDDVIYYKTGFQPKGRKDGKNPTPPKGIKSAQCKG